MPEYIVGNEYETAVRGTAQALMPFVRAAEVSAEVTKTARGSQVVFPMTVLPTGEDNDALSLNAPAVTQITNDDRDVVIPLEILGKSYHTYDGVASLQETVAERSLRSKVLSETVIAANTLDAKAAAAVAAVPITGDKTFTHEMGPDTLGTNWQDPIAAGLLHVGNAAASLADAKELDGNNKISASILRVMVQMLVNRNVRPVGYLDEGDLDTFLYRCILTDKQMLDLRDEVKEDSITSANKYIASDGRVLAGTFRIWSNLILQTSPRLKHAITPDAGDKFYAHRAIVFGRDYLGMGATPVDDLPVSDDRVERIVMAGELDEANARNPQGSSTPIPRIFEVRKTPSSDPQGRLSYIAWLSHCGFRLLNPLSGVQLVTRASNDPTITP